jgi:hypothetical protein
MSDIFGRSRNKQGRKPPVEGTTVELKFPPKLLARVDAIVARQPDPKPTRDKIVIRLVRRALKARAAKRKAQAKPK